MSEIDTTRCRCGCHDKDQQGTIFHCFGDCRCESPGLVCDPPPKKLPPVEVKPFGTVEIPFIDGAKIVSGVGVGMANVKGIKKLEFVDEVNICDILEANSMKTPAPEDLGVPVVYEPPSERLVCHNCGHKFPPGAAGTGCCQKPDLHLHNLKVPCWRCKD